MEINFKNKNILVCGGSRGIGKAIAIEFAKLGGNVSITGRTTSDLESTLQELQNVSESIHKFYAVDFTEQEEVEKFLNEVAQENFDIIVNNSGGPAPGDLVNAQINDFQDAFQAHILASQQIAQKFIPKMKERNFGRFINIISTSVRQPINGLGVSNTIRGAMASWSKTLSNEVAKFGITVNNILPGFTETGRLEKIIKIRMENNNQSEEEVVQNMLAQVPAGKFTKPEDIAYAVMFLCSPYASKITGTNIPVDGGMITAL